MPKLYVDGIHVVGMYHYGSQQLGIGEPHKVMSHPSNIYDRNAVRITKFEDDRTVAYVARYHNAVVKEMIEKVARNGKVYLKPKFSVSRVGRKPTQICTIGMFVDSEDLEKGRALAHRINCTTRNSKIQ
jgi:hypothetical protein